MKKDFEILAIILGVVIILSAPVLGKTTADFLLDFFGGMDANHFTAIFEGCIRGFQIIGTLCAIYGILGIQCNKKGQ